MTWGRLGAFRLRVGTDGATAASAPRSPRSGRRPWLVERKNLPSGFLERTMQRPDSSLLGKHPAYAVNGPKTVGRLRTRRNGTMTFHRSTSTHPGTETTNLDEAKGLHCRRPRLALVQTSGKGNKTSKSMRTMFDNLWRMKSKSPEIKAAPSSPNEDRRVLTTCKAPTAKPRTCAPRRARSVSPPQHPQMSKEQPNK